MHTCAGDLSALLDADLGSAGWCGSLEPYPGMSARNFAMLALRKSLTKKFLDSDSNPECDKKALDLFTSVNEACRNYRVPQFDSSLLEIAINEAKSFIDRFYFKEGLPLLLLSTIEKGCGFGPGANIGAKSGDPYGKLAISNLTYTDPALLVLFKHTCKGHSLWDEQELFRSQNYKTYQVQGSNLSFVPKTNEISRTICTEPILNMYFQKGIARVLEERLVEVVGIDLSKQPDKNKRLAQIGAATGEFGTIDLSSASDSMSRTLVSEFFPASMVSWLDKTRSDYARLKNGASLELHMVSSMGNAYTFPLQTLFFTSLVVGAYRALDIPIQFPRGHSVGNFAVFGDDIIVVSKAYRLVTRMLSHCGFTVNDNKSFSEGLFRESCGSDYYGHHNVRGVYIKRLRDDQDCYSAFNRLILWSSRHDIGLNRLLEHIYLLAKQKLFVPFHEDDEAGFKVPSDIALANGVAWNRKAQAYTYLSAIREPYAITLPLDESVSGAQLRKLNRAYPGWKYSPAGMLLLMLHGNIRNGLISFRIQRRKTAYRKRISSCWSLDPCVRPEMAGFDGRVALTVSMALFSHVKSPK